MGPKPKSFFQKLFLQNPVRDMVQGVKEVSKVCRHKRKAECIKEGCQWNAGACRDFSKWECSERKKVTNCFSYKFGSPYALAHQIKMMPTPMGITLRSPIPIDMTV